MANMSDSQWVGNSLSEPTSQISAVLAKVCRAYLGNDLRAVVLTGSLVRDEGSFIREDKAWTLIGDVDVVAVLHENRPDPSAELAASIVQAAESGMAAALISAHVSIGYVQPKFLRKLEPHIFGYELRECGRVIEGDSSVLNLIPPFRSSEIPRTDAFRLLCNRTLEFLAKLAERELTSSAPEEIQYSILKLYLDMATSLLVFTGDYVPTYRGRCEKLREVAKRHSVNRLPFNMERFSFKVKRFTELKVKPCRLAFQAADLEEAISDASRLHNWEADQLGHSHFAFKRKLRPTIRSESVSQWARGWIYLLRSERWIRSWRDWPRWLRLAYCGSPRYLIYSAGFALLILCSDVLRGRRIRPGELEFICELLPLRVLGGCEDWKVLAQHVERQYKKLLISTRA